MGVSWDEFWRLNPHIIDLLLKGHRERMIMRDEELWRLGIYVREALKSSVCNNGLWKGKGQALDEYPEEPFMRNTSSDKKELSEEDMQREVDKFFAQESVRRANWKRTHKRQENV